jgi:predicted HAD superfamily Cof-like phosphohydrolase
MYESLISEEYGEWFSAYDPEEMEDQPVEELKELADLVYVIYGYAISLGWNLDEAVRRVHENNMGRMYQPDGTIKRREDGKILKNPEYPKVELGDLV